MKRFLPLIGMVVLSQGCIHSSVEPIPVDESYVHVRPSWAPDGRTIAFSGYVNSAQGIYVIDTASTTPQVVQYGPGIGLTWSPDTQWIAFSSGGKLCKIRRNGANFTPLTPGPSDFRPSWSPDGTRLAFIHLVPQMLDLQTGLVTQIVDFGDFPTWHPNGRDVVFLNATPVSFSENRYEFARVNPSTGVVEVYDALPRFTSSVGFCSMNADSSAIIMSIKPPNERAQIEKLQIGVSPFFQLTTEGGDYPAWSPDGKKIVYTRTAPGDGGLWIMNADGTGKRRLTTP